jgi:hypothetical protein
MLQVPVQQVKAESLDAKKTATVRIRFPESHKIHQKLNPQEIQQTQTHLIAFSILPTFSLIYRIWMIVK